MVIQHLTVNAVHLLQVAELRAAIGPLTGRLEQFADDACLMRYLRARDWNLKNSEKMLKESLAWRDSYKPEDIRWVSFRPPVWVSC